MTDFVGFICFEVELGKDMVVLFFTMGENHSEMNNYLELNEIS